MGLVNLHPEFGRLLLAAVLGAVIGIERHVAGKTAGVRTYALVALGSCLFSYISKYGFDEFVGLSAFDPSRIASQIVVGVGFIGAGMIFLHGNKLRGLTTAAGLWVSAAIGMAVGLGLYGVAIFVTVLTIIIFALLWGFEGQLAETNDHAH